MSTIIRQEFAGAINGVDGRFFNVVAAEDGRILNQEWSATRHSKKHHKVAVYIRFDDQCNNKHETFSITGQTWEGGKEDCGGCIHDIITEVFPELAYLIKWHLVSTDGPMHYVANATYHAGNRDHRGLLKGEESTDPRLTNHYVRFGNSPIEHKVGKRLKAFIDKTIAEDGEFILDKVEHKKDKASDYEFKPKYQLAGMDCAWHECPFDDEDEARQWIDAITGCEMHWTSRTNVYGEGKERNLDAARSIAIWPEATDEELCVPKEELTKKLLDRLPVIMEQFKSDVVATGLLWPVAR